MIPDQKTVWEKKHSMGEHESFRGDPSPFAQIVAGKIAKRSKILELGCGVGRDAIFFASKNHIVIATDFSEVVIKRDAQIFHDSSVNFQVLDMSQTFPFEGGSFDVVYANLAIHYYLDTDTRKIVAEIARVLKSGDLFAFACKSVNDFHYGNGEEVEKDVFVSSKGHVRHLFSEEYARDLVKEKFEVIFLDEVVETYSGEKSAMVRCIARKS
jgi:SAM-dependent methyltransferase